jgi:hypothetical protein
LASATHSQPRAGARRPSLSARLDLVVLHTAHDRPARESKLSVTA